MRLVLALLALSAPAGAVASAELYQNQAYTYGRFEARVRFAAGDGVVSSFFLWKPGSEMPGTFWNELDFEKIGADCRLQTNPLYGLPVADHSQIAMVNGELCGEYHTYEFEWTPTYIAYRVDGVEIRRDVGETAAAFATNAAQGMQIHFNIWPGDATFGGNFEPSILPVQQYISWVQYASFADGVFTPEWREDFSSGSLPSGWALGNWPSPKNLSTHQPANTGFVDGVAVLSLTADDATGFSGTAPADEASNPSGTDDPGNGAGATGAEPTAGTGSVVSGVGGAAGASGMAGGTSGASGVAQVSPTGPSATGGAATPSNPSSRTESDASCSHIRGAGRGLDAAAVLLCLGLGIFVTRRRPA